MNRQADLIQETVSDDETEVRRLYHDMLQQWNNRSALGMASLFTDSGNVIGFDGSPMNGKAEIEATLSSIFRDHQTATYVGKVREVRFITPEVAVLRSVSGMVPHGKSDLNPGVNTVQTLVAAKHEGQWRVEIYQNTPAAFHGRPEMSEALTDELRLLLTQGANI